MATKIKIICVGKTSEPFVREGIKLYEQRIKHFTGIQIVELPDVKAGSVQNKLYVKEKEMLAVSKHINPEDTLILLDENGTTYNSLEFASFIEKHTSTSRSLVFIIGGAYGFSELLYQKAKHKLSLSKLTYTHQLVRVIFLEQLYRAFTIIRNIPYHNQ